MLAQRLISAAIGIPIIIGIVLLGGPLYDVAVAVILGIAAIEFCALFRPPVTPPRAWWSMPPWGPVVAVVIAVMVVFAGDIVSDETGYGAAAIAIAMLLLVMRREHVLVRPWWLSLPLAVLYVGFLGAHFVPLRDLDGDGEWVFLAVLSTWGTDTFAYAAGKLFGNHKMAPGISPGKTWEGTAGGLIGGLLTVVALEAALGLPMTTGQAVILGALLPVFAVIADLAESLLKRGAGVKDTSELVPGHGGFLDRLDSLLLTVPLVYYFAVWVVFD